MTLAQEHAAKSPAVAQKAAKPTAKRYNLFHRFAHAIVTFGVIGAAVTGFPLKYKDLIGMDWFTTKLGGVIRMGLYHRIFAGMIIGYLVFQTVYMLYYFVARLFGSEAGGLTWILPRKRETLDVKANALYLIGRRPEPSFKKYVYWGVFDWVINIAGIFAIVVTGAMVWFPEVLARWLPGTWLNSAYVIHSQGAILIVVVILVTHFYNIYWSTGHISDCMVIFTGRMTARRKKLQ